MNRLFFLKQYFRAVRLKTVYKARHAMIIRYKITKFNPYDAKLDAEEQEMLESYEQGEWKSVDNLAQEMLLAKEAATNTLRKK